VEGSWVGVERNRVDASARGVKADGDEAAVTECGRNVGEY
jgi:hypothetical protein